MGRDCRWRRPPSPARRVRLLIAAALLALLLGALDALVVGAAMPTIVADLGGLHLYSWVFSAYLLTRAIALPIFGKLCDLFSSRRLYVAAIGIFVVSSVCAGAAHEMSLLIVFRALQGVGAGGTFALAYIVLSDISPPEQRGKMMGLISFVWGVASILGPALGGFIVNYFSWRWIFYINVPLGALALLGIVLYLEELREKKRETPIDFLGALTLSAAVLALLIASMLGGRSYDWFSMEIGGLLLTAAGAAVAFCHAERRAREPILELAFFRNRNFSLANASAFFSSFAIFSLSAFSPLFIQGALGKTPAQLGLTMVSLSLGWSGGAFLCGQLVNRAREKTFAVLGSLVLMAGTALTLTFTPGTALSTCSMVLALAGFGMGFVSISTLLIVQNSLDASNLGVATSSQQFFRTLGGTIGIGLSGSLATQSLTRILDGLANTPSSADIPQSLSMLLSHNPESLLHPHVQGLLPESAQKLLQEALGQGVQAVFWAALATALLSLLLCIMLSQPESSGKPKNPSPFDC